MLTRLAYASIALGIGVGFGCSSVEGTGDTPAEIAEIADQTEGELLGLQRATLRDAAGSTVGTVVFAQTGAVTTVAVTARMPHSETKIHGFHVHANDDPSNGEGCLADPAEPAETHFVSADGHYNPAGTTHGQHAGDMPALVFTASGYAAMSFVFDRFDPAEVRGRAVILHQRPDNYGNVPTGTAPSEYTPNSEEATTLTRATGNAGNRLACGIIR